MPHVLPTQGQMGVISSQDTAGRQALTLEQRVLQRLAV